MNTVFKLGYQAWLLLGLGGIGALACWRAWLPRPRTLRLGVRGADRARRGGRARLPDRRHLRAQRRLRARPTLDGLGWLRDRAPGDVERDRLAQRPRAGGRRRARGRRRRLLRLRPRADLDVHRPADRARLARPRAAVGPRRRRPRARGRRAGCTAVRRRRRRCRCCARYDVRYVVVGPLERTDYGDGGVAKWDELGRRVFDRDGTTIWELRSRRALAHVEPLGQPAGRVPRLALA